MQFIEISGRQLLELVREGGPKPEELADVGVTDESLVRINRQGDIELRRYDRWDIIGGLLGEFEDRVRAAAGLDWA